MSRNLPVFFILLFAGLFLLPGFAAEVAWQQSFDEGLGAAAVTGPSPQMIEGRGKSGKAVVLRGGQSLTYDISKVFNADRGSISFWLKPVDWDGDTSEPAFRFLELINPDGKEYLRYEKKSKSQYGFRPFTASHGHFDFKTADYFYGCDALTGNDGWKKDEWNHIVFNWDRTMETAETFVNGRWQIRRYFMFLPKGLTKMTIGPGARKDEPSTAYDDIVIYPYTLTPSEVKALYAWAADGGKGATPVTQKNLILQTQYLRLDQLVDVRVDVGAYEKEDGISARVRVTDKAGKKDLLPPVEFKSFKNGWAKQDVSIKDLPLGDFCVTAELLKGGNVVKSSTHNIQKDEKLDWESVKQLGKTDRVLPPWTPLKRSEADGKQVVECWGRTYSFDPGSIIRQMTARGEDLFASKVKLEGRSNGQQIKFGTPKMELVSASDTMVVLRSTSRSILSYDYTIENATSTATSELALQVDYMIDYTGFVKIEITLDPQLKKGGKLPLELLELQFPFQPSRVLYYQHRNWNRKYGTETQLQYYPAIAHTGVAFPKGTVQRDLPWTPHFWVGDNDRGLNIAMESFADFVFDPAEKDKLIQMVSEPEVAKVIYRLIYKPGHAIDKPLKYLIMVQAQPVRPEKKGWRDYRAEEIRDNEALVKRHPELYWVQKHYEGKLTVIGNGYYQTPSEDLYYPVGRGYPGEEKAMNDAIHAKGAEVKYYMIANFSACATREGRRNLEAWQVVPRGYSPYFEGNKYWMEQVRKKDKNILGFYNHFEEKNYPDPEDCPDYGFTGGAGYMCMRNTKFEDYVAWGIYYLVQHYGADALHMDMCAVSPCIREDHGCGQLHGDGKRWESYPILAQREMQRRVANIFFEAGKPDPYIYCNFGDGERCTINQTFSSYVHSGEHLNAYTTKGQRYDEFVSPELIRAQYMGRQTGYPCVTSPQLGATRDTLRYQIEDPSWTREFLKYNLLHDMVSASEFISYPERHRLWDANQRFGGMAQMEEFLPYWDIQGKVVSAGNPDVTKVSLYRAPKKVLAAIGNFEDEKRTVTFKVLDSKPLGFQPGKAWDPYTEKSYAPDGDGWKVELSPHDFRLVVLEPK